MAGAVTLGKYRLMRCLGRGGMGVVHLALAQGPVGFEKLCALKLLDPKFRGDRHRSESLLREALVGGRLDHEHLVQIFDLGVEVDQYFIAMEYVRGFSLSHVLAHLRQTGRQLPIYLAVRIVRAVNDALVYMHGLTFGQDQPLGLVHGDISPSNILLGADGRMKLSDLGVVALSGEVRSHIAGKTAYFPPEAFRGLPRTQTWDVYALGAVLFEALTGKRTTPADDEALEDTAPAAQLGPSLLAELRPDCPPELAAVVERTLAREPAARLRHATALAEALDAAMPETPGERDRHRSYLSALYAELDFVKDHGELPSESGVPSDIAPKVAEEETEQVTARGVRGERVLRLGISPAHGSQRARQSGERVAQELSRRLSRPVRTVVLGDYEALVESLTASDLDLAWMPPLALVDALDRGAGVLAVASRAGATVYNAAVIVHADSPLRALEDVGAATAAFVDQSSASGYVFAVAGMVRALGPERLRALKPHFHGSHRAVCEAVANRWVDLGATYAVVRASGELASAAWTELVPERAAEIRALWMSGPIPSDCMAYRPHLPDRVANEVRDALLGLAGEPDGAALLRDVFGADTFVRGALEDYEAARVARDLVARAFTPSS